MRVFVSWSGTRSKLVATALSEWLPNVLQCLEPWLSSDIEKGERWPPALQEQLESSRHGIICLTPENLTAPWILFEAGAISKLKDSRACTFLVDVEPAQIEYPLAQFQHTRSTREDVLALLHTLNGSMQAPDRSLDKRALESAFNMWWPQLEVTLSDIAKQKTGVRRVSRSNEEVLDEILELVRALNKPAKTLAGSLERLLGTRDGPNDAVAGFQVSEARAKRNALAQLVDWLPDSAAAANALRDENELRQAVAKAQEMLEARGALDYSIGRVAAEAAGIAPRVRESVPTASPTHSNEKGV